MHNCQLSEWTHAKPGEIKTVVTHVSWSGLPDFREQVDVNHAPEPG